MAAALGFTVLIWSAIVEYEQRREDRVFARDFLSWSVKMGERANDGSTSVLADRELSSCATCSASSARALDSVRSNDRGHETVETGKNHRACNKCLRPEPLPPPQVGPCLG